MGLPPEKAQGAATVDPTCRNYNSQEAAPYAENYHGYSPDIYGEYVGFHTPRGGFGDTILDADVVKSLALHFNHAVECGLWREMIERARKEKIVTRSKNPIQNEVLEPNIYEQQSRSTLSSRHVDGGNGEYYKSYK